MKYISVAGTFFIPGKTSEFYILLNRGSPLVFLGIKFSKCYLNTFKNGKIKQRRY